MNKLYAVMYGNGQSAQFENTDFERCKNEADRIGTNDVYPGCITGGIYAAVIELNGNQYGKKVYENNRPYNNIFDCVYSMPLSDIEL